MNATTGSNTFYVRLSKAYSQLYVTIMYIRRSVAVSYSYALYHRHRPHPCGSFYQNFDEIIDQDNELRILDLFVESLDLSTFSFHLKGSEEKRAFGNMAVSFCAYVQ